MRRKLRWLAVLVAATASLGTSLSAAAQGGGECRGAALAVQVLGSGGPIADDGRASTGYLVWVAGHARILVDAGSGTFVRFGEAGADFADLEVIAISHFHTDHVGALPGLLKSGYFSPRTHPLAVTGPGGSGPFPGLNALLPRLLEEKAGAFGYLAGYLDGSGGLVQLKPMEVALDSTKPVLLADETFRLEALPVPHGIVPSLAYRVQIGDRSIVFGSDQNGTNPAFVDLARNADLLVLHAVIPENAGRTARALHATPSRLAAIVTEARPQRTLLSHWMARSLRVQEGILSTVQTAAGDKPVLAAEDLACTMLEP
ncbi:MAG: MBL fold metallo-hydrolase [Pseudomonadota bacterium]